MTATKFDPDWVIAPGETLKDWLDENGLSGKSCVTYGIPQSTFDGIVAGTTPINAVLAQKLCNMTLIGAPMWLALEHNFRAGLNAGKKWRNIP